MEQVLIRLQMIINRCVKVKEGRSTAGNGGAFFMTWVPRDLPTKMFLHFCGAQTSRGMTKEEYNLGPGVKHRDDKGRI